jgi:putative transposase
MSQRNNPKAHHRRSTRLPEWDYRSPGAYFVTLVTHERQCLFDDPALRRIVETAWKRVPRNFRRVSLDEWVVMPNHVHGIIVIGDVGGAGEAGGGLQPGAGSAARPGSSPEGGSSAASPLRPAGLQSGSLGAIVGTFKSLTAKYINRARETYGAPVWQRNYHEHVIRDEREWNVIRQYIRENPVRWAEDDENPDRHV